MKKYLAILFFVFCAVSVMAQGFVTPMVNLTNYWLVPTNIWSSNILSSPSIHIHQETTNFGRLYLYATNGIVTNYTADASPDGAADFVLTYDADANALKKVLLNNLPSGGGGEINTINDLGATNLSTSYSINSNKVGSAFQFYNLVEGTGITIDQNATGLVFNATGGGGGGPGSLDFNLNQFDTNGVVDILSGAPITNGVYRGSSWPNLTADRVAGLNASGNLTNSQDVTLAELAFLDNANQNVQVGLDNLEGATNGLTTRVDNLDGATNGLTTRVDGHDTDISNIQAVTNKLAMLGTTNLATSYSVISNDVGGVVSFYTLVEGTVVTIDQTATGLVINATDYSTDISNLQGATNGLTTRVDGHDTDISNLQGATNGLNIGVSQRQIGSFILSNFVVQIGMTNIDANQFIISSGTLILKSNAFATNVTFYGSLTNNGTFYDPAVTPNRVATWGGSGGLTDSSTIDTTELGYLDGLSELLTTTIANLQGGTNGLNTDVSNLQGATNGLNTDVSNLQGATNGLTTRLDGHDTDISNLQAATNVLQGASTVLTNLAGTQAITNLWSQDFTNHSTAGTNFVAPWRDLISRNMFWDDFSRPDSTNIANGGTGLGSISPSGHPFVVDGPGLGDLGETNAYIRNGSAVIELVNNPTAGNPTFYYIVTNRHGFSRMGARVTQYDGNGGAGLHGVTIAMKPAWGANTYMIHCTLDRDNADVFITTNGVANLFRIGDIEWKNQLTNGQTTMFEIEYLGNNTIRMSGHGTNMTCRHPQVDLAFNGVSENSGTVYWQIGHGDTNASTRMELDAIWAGSARSSTPEFNQNQFSQRWNGPSGEEFHGENYSIKTTPLFTNIMDFGLAGNVVNTNERSSGLTNLFFVTQDVGTPAGTDRVLVSDLSSGTVGWAAFSEFTGAATAGGADRNVQYNNGTSLDGASGVNIPSGSETNLNVNGNLSAYNQSVTNLLTLEGDGTTEPLLILKDGDGSHQYAFKVPATLATRYTNVFDFEGTVSADDVLTIHGVTDGVIVWTNEPAAGGGTPAGNDTLVQYNGAGAFAAVSNLMYIAADGEIIITNTIGSSDLLRVKQGANELKIGDNEIGTVNDTVFRLHSANGARWEVQNSVSGHHFAPVPHITYDIGTPTQQVRSNWNQTVYSTNLIISGPGATAETRGLYLGSEGNILVNSNLVYDAATGEVAITNHIGSQPLLYIYGNSGNIMKLGNQRIGLENDSPLNFLVNNAERWRIDADSAGSSFHPIANVLRDVGLPTAMIRSNWNQTVYSTNLIIKESLQLYDLEVAPVSGDAGLLTNYVIQSVENTIRMTNTVNISNIVAAASGVKEYYSITLTNKSGSAQNIGFVGPTIEWMSDIPTSVADQASALLTFLVTDSDVYASYADGSVDASIVRTNATTAQGTNFIYNVSDIGTPASGDLLPILDISTAERKFVDIGSLPSGGGSPAGNDTLAQFNDGGAFGAISNLMYIAADGEVIITNTIGSATLRVKDNSGNEMLVEPTQIGTESATVLSLRQNGSTKWQIGPSFNPAIDGTYDIGSSATRVRTNYNDTVTTTDLIIDGPGATAETRGLYLGSGGNILVNSNLMYDAATGIIIVTNHIGEARLRIDNGTDSFSMTQDSFGVDNNIPLSLFVNGTDKWRIGADSTGNEFYPVNHITRDFGRAASMIRTNWSLTTVSTNIILFGKLQLGSSGSTYYIDSVTNNVAVTNLFGIAHQSSAAVIEIDANDSHDWVITNRITAATTLVITNTADGQDISIRVIGEASGGTDRTLTLVPQLGHLIADEDDYSQALATSSSLTLTNGNAVEISWAVRRMNGTNVAGKISRQFKF